VNGAIVDAGTGVVHEAVDDDGKPGEDGYVPALLCEGLEGVPTAAGDIGPPDAVFEAVACNAQLGRDEAMNPFAAGRLDDTLEAFEVAVEVADFCGRAGHANAYQSHGGSL